MSWPKFEIFLIRDFLISLDPLGPKGALSGLRQFLAIENPIKMMENAFYFILKAFFVPRIFKFMSWLLGHIEKRLD